MPLRFLFGFSRGRLLSTSTSFLDAFTDRLPAHIDPRPQAGNYRLYATSGQERLHFSTS
jgi:hypothetical protein